MIEVRYNSAAIVLHWAIALAIVANMFLGWWMHEAIEVSDTQARAAAAYQVHKSIGLTVLALSLLRLGLRLACPTPPLPAGMAAWQQWGARATHWLFYALMLGLPLSGWLMVSAQWRDGAPLQVPTLWFGWFEVPHLFGLDQAANSTRSGIHGAAYEAHELFVLITLLLLGLHIAAALKHQFADGDEVLARMVPGLEPAGSAARRWSLVGGFALMLLAAMAIACQLLLSPGATDGGDRATEITSVRGSWQVVPEDSAIHFAGTHAGQTFRGRFTRWQADVRIAGGSAESSRIRVTVQTGSATDGVKLHDDTLPGTEWFDVEHYPTAQYRADEVRRIGDGRYRVDGALTIKGRDIPVPGLVLTLTGEGATISGSVTIDRANADLGMESDPGGQWVSRQIEVDVKAAFLRP